MRTATQAQISIYGGLLTAVGGFAGVTIMVLSTPFPAYRDYRSMESTAVPVGEGQIFWTTLWFLPGALWLGVTAGVGLLLALRWWSRRHGGPRHVSPALTALTAGWLTAVGIVAWCVLSQYRTPGRGPGPMIAWAFREVGWAFGWTVITPGVIALAAVALVHFGVRSFRWPPPSDF